MFDSIYQDPDLFALVRQHCGENEVGATMDANLLDDGGHLKYEKVVVLKLDAFYSSHRMHNPPPAPDYLVIVKCCDGSYEGYVIELRDVSQTSAVRSSQITKKFKTALNDFVGQRYRHLFFNGEEIVFRSLKLYLVTDPLGLKSRCLSPEEYSSRIKGTVLDAYGALDPIVVGTKAFMIEPVLPDPTIHSC